MDILYEHVCVYVWVCRDTHVVQLCVRGSKVDIEYFSQTLCNLFIKSVSLPEPGIYQFWVV